MARRGNRVNVVVSVDDDHVDATNEVAERLRATGMQVEETMDALGTVAGSVDSSLVGRLASVEGVSEIEEERVYQLPDPDADLQ